MKTSFDLFFVILILFSFSADCSNQKANKLGYYNVDINAISVSGFSSGGAMSMQFHFIFSSSLKGAGIFAGSPYLCGGNFLLCLVTPGLIDTNLLISRVNAFSNNSSIDNVTNVENKKVFIYHGVNDTSNGPANGRKIQAMYENYNADITSNLDTNSEHGMPTDNYGAMCGQSAKETQYITNCNYKGAFEMLNHIYDGNLTYPKDDLELIGELLQFDQNEFFMGGSANSYSMNDTGYVYIPSKCSNTNNSIVSCKLHVVFHGCSQYSGLIDDIYVLHTGYLQTAEVNSIITIFPQTIPSNELGNPGGCWDTWGFAEINGETENYGTKYGNQVVAIFSMLQRIAYG